MQRLNRDSLHRGGFAGLRETRLVVDYKVGGQNDTWNGIGNFIYLADARFMPKGQTGMHPHKELDVISIMLEGSIEHQGSLENGKSMHANQVQAQRAGGEGFVHNEMNPDNTENRMLQLWVLPETSGEPASYKFHELKKDRMVAVYGGNTSQNITLDSHTIIEVGLLTKNKNVIHEGEFIAYITGGEGILNGIEVKDGDLVRDEKLDFTVISEDVHLTLIYVNKAH
ncbi:pilus protein [Marinomonas ushuaiensis DSM 15871]|uniref:Pilus protein n=1 Tax=Marinomonas ushuaiensis DSM 15871 TaxID=1122207 RepID=X7E5Y4_9GAMM|nr:pirin family protein [Marinomonas ushuaiensis]ETX11357.1 pilus protein [Marinomonas ushuaiensis DSM 15871]